MTENAPSKAVVLIFPCGTEIGLEIHRSMCQSTHVTLIGASSKTSNHGVHVFSRYIDNLPYVDDPDFVSRMNTLVKQHNVDFLFPAHDDAVTALCRHESELGCTVIGSPLETCTLCRSKSATYAKFSTLIPSPKLYAPDAHELPFPLFVKPDAGQGSQGARKVNSLQALAAAQEEEPTLIIMEYLPGTEYTVDCFTDRHGALRFIGPRERVRTVNGISVHTRTVPLDREFTQYAQTINETLEFRGAWFFQVKRNNKGILTLLEIAPRISGGMGLYRNLGVNIPLLSVYDQVGLDLKIRPLQMNLEMDRALKNRFHSDLEYAHVYIDLDDTILNGDKVNVMTVAFIHQCRNEGKQLHLLTRHKSDLEETLAKHGLAQLLDFVSPLRTGECKASHIHYKNAIFIDDSYSERCQVQDATGIPVFAPNAIESLMDW
ncbi:MAG: ATP-grasp domain-containing protein, partial [Candidatus Hydrogenedentes bacterium]|nr:ATP-grasp domain-containing protein [Candidatus Hydrogenedentota bacterium]